MSDIRILAGVCKGTKLITLDGDKTRPTTGRIAENIFNILQHNKYVENFSFKKQNILDICAGSGRLGLEALSRGAKSATFIDNNPDAGKIIHSNIKKCHATAYTEFLNANAFNITLSSVYYPFSLVFCDAPYGHHMPHKIINHLIDKKWLTQNALFCIETERDYIFEEIPCIQIMDKRDYGISSIYFLKYNLLF